MKKPLLFIGFNVAVVIALSLVRVIVSNSISTSGAELGNLQKEISLLKKKNAVLHEQVLVASSLTQIASKAGTLGFENADSPLVLSQDIPLAKR